MSEVWLAYYTPWQVCTMVKHGIWGQQASDMANHQGNASIKLNKHYYNSTETALNYNYQVIVGAILSLKPVLSPKQSITNILCTLARLYYGKV